MNLFGFFKRRKVELTATELDAIVRSAEAAVSVKWLQFINALHFKSDVSLADRIDAFAHPVQDFIFREYPALREAPGSVFWLIVFNAVTQSKSHTQAQIDEAVAVLRTRHVRPRSQS